MSLAIGIGDSAKTQSRLRTGSVNGSGTVDGSELETLMDRRLEAMGTIVKSRGATLGLIMSPRIATLVHQTDDLRSPLSEESVVCPRLETAVTLRRREQKLARPHLTGPRQLGQARGVHPGDGPRSRMHRETKLHLSA